MKTLMLAAALATLGFAGFAGSASAMPTSPFVGAGSALVETVAYGCGRGFVPNRWGRCVPNAARPAPAYRPDPYYGRGRDYRRGPVPTNRTGYGRVCPPGAHAGPRGGFCQPNY